jgi:multimeric flavodoxin WrbA
MNKLAVVYHSAHGHTEHIAGRIVEGAREATETVVHLLKAEDLLPAPEVLVAYDGIILGSPTYLGGVSAPFKRLMDATGRMWKNQQLAGKLAAGFTVSSLPSGDKQSTLISMSTFAMQHGMIWVGNAILPEQHAGVPYEQAANRLGSWTGLMAQAGHGSSAEAKGPGRASASAVVATPAPTPEPQAISQVAVPDSRIRAVVALAPMAVVFTPESLGSITVSVRVIMAERDDVLNGKYHGGHAVAHLPGAQASTAAGAGHFAFMAQPVAPMPSAAGDAAINPSGFDRAAYLEVLERQVTGFFDKQWQ